MKSIKAMWDGITKTYRIIFGGGGVIAVVIMIKNFGEKLGIIDLIISYPSGVLILISVLFVLSMGFIVGLVSNMRKDEQVNCWSVQNKRWKHPVLIVDDDIEYLAILEDALKSKINQGMVDILYITSLPDARLVKEFEIIISDVIDNLFRKERHSTGVLKEVKDKYPYKIVIPMSTLPETIRKEDLYLFDENVICKPQNQNINEEFVNHMVGIIEENCKKLEKIDKYWEKTEERLKQQNVNDYEIKTKRQEYYSYINFVNPYRQN